MNAHSTIEAAPIGHNNPPAPTPFEAIKLHIDDLFETAQGYLDGEPVTTQAVADDIGRLLDDARKAQKAADAQRKVEAAPFDAGKAAVQALWTPYSDEKKGRAAMIADMAKRALAPFLIAQQKVVDDAAAAARAVADAAAEKARQEIADANHGADLAARERAEEAIDAAEALTKAANKLEGGRAKVAGGARAVSLRSVWTAELIDPVEALKHYRATQGAALKEWLCDQARQCVASGSRELPGFKITETKVAV